MHPRLAADLDDANVAYAMPLLAILLEQKDRSTSDHCDRVMRYAVRLAINVGVAADAVQTIRTAAVLHDIGKVDVPDDVLSHPGPLDEGRMNLVRAHALRGEQIVQRFPGKRMLAVARIVGAHHEWFDGTGYPRGLSADRIPLGARIIAVCDAFDAMTAGRTYAPPRSRDAALDELVRFSGRQFDPELVSTFIAMDARRFRFS